MTAFDRTATKIIEGLDWRQSSLEHHDTRIADLETQLTEARTARADYLAWHDEQLALLELLGYAHSDKATGDLIITNPQLTEQH